MLMVIFAFLLAHADDPAALKSQLAKRPNDIRLREQTAAAFAAAGKLDQVIELLNAYTDQLSEPGFLQLAGAYSSQKAYVDEVRVLKIITARHDDSHQWHMLLGQAYLKQASITTTSFETNRQLVTSGIQELRRALEIDRRYKLAFDTLLVTLLKQKANNEARELLVEGIERFGDRPELYRELCRLDALDGFLQQAIMHCKMSINLSPSYPDHYVYLTQALQDSQEDARAEKEIIAAAQRFPRDEFVQWAAGTMFINKKNFPVAARYFQAAVTADPTKGRSQYGLAQSLFKSGRADQALEHFQVACRLAPESLEDFLSSGSRLKQEGKAPLGAKYMSAASDCTRPAARNTASEAPPKPR